MIALRDGRKVRVEEYGDPTGVPALWFHGGYSSRLEGGLLDAAAQELGLRVVSLDRPGFGGSDPHPGRTVAGYGADVAEVLDALDIERAAVGGLSNGGMFTMAVSATIPDRVVRAVPVNSTTPVADLAARAALTRAGRLSYAFLARDPQRTARQALASESRGRFATWVSRVSNPDWPLLTEPANAAHWAATLAEARKQGVDHGLLPELRMAVSPWGFDHRAVPVPVAMVSGEKDTGLGYARIWAEELPQGRLVVVPGGHTGILAPRVARRIVELLLGRP